MIVATAGQFAPRPMQSERETAQSDVIGWSAYRDSENTCDCHFAAGSSSKLSTAFCQHRYPSPCRSVPTQDRPAYSFHGAVNEGIPDLAGNRYTRATGLEVAAYFVDSCFGKKQNKGTSVCLRNLGFSQQLQQLAWLAVSTMTQSARLLALALAALLAKQSATTTVLKARLAALLSAHWLTISNTLQLRLVHFERRRGATPAALSV